MPDALRLALSVDALGPRLTGIGRYCLELAERMPGALGVGRVSYFRHSHWIDDPRALLAEDWHPRPRPRWRRGIEDWQRRRRMAGAVVHAPNYFLPEWATRGVATIHDLSVFRYPETHPPERIAIFEREFARTLDQARLLITDSETVRGELIASFGVNPERVRAIPLAASRPAAAAVGSVEAVMGLVAGGYILCVSTFEPRKRIAELVRAHVSLDPALRARYPLVLAGATGWRNEALLAEIAEAARDGSVRMLGFVDDASLAALYAGAALFVYPSRYEGFGLPVVEAMAAGAPCLIGDAACLIEVAQGAARVANPEDIEGFGAMLAEALEDAAWRAAAAEAGRAVAAGYSWERCVSETVAAYRSV